MIFPFAKVSQQARQDILDILLPSSSSQITRISHARWDI